MWFPAEGKIAMLISGKKEEKMFIFSSSTHIFKFNFITFSELRKSSSSQKNLSLVTPY